MTQAGLQGRPIPRASALPASKALFFAWLVEIVAVAMGLILAVFAGIEGSDGGPIAIAIAILPFAALSIIELTKIPLVGLAFRVQSPFWRLLAFITLLLVTGATFENFVFGFERGFNERIRSVQTAEMQVQRSQAELALAETRLPQLDARQAEISARLAALRDDAAAIRQQSRQDIEDVRTNNNASSYTAERGQIERELASLDGRRDAAIAAERARCRAFPDSRCGVGAVAATYGRQRDQLARRMEQLGEGQRAQEATAGADVTSSRQRRDTQLSAIDRERGQLEGELDTVRGQLTEAHTVALQGSDVVARATRQRDEMIERSQLHRLADVLFGGHATATLEQTKRLFVVSLAAIVALVGSLIAAMYYAAETERLRRRGILRRAIRAYLARHRRAIPVRRKILYTPKERAGLVRNLRGWLARRRRRRLPVQVREVVREVPVDRLKLVFLPLDATEEQIARVRAEAQREAA